MSQSNHYLLSIVVITLKQCRIALTAVNIHEHSLVSKLPTKLIMMGTEKWDGNVRLHGGRAA